MDIQELKQATKALRKELMEVWSDMAQSKLNASQKTSPNESQPNNRTLDELFDKLYNHLGAVEFALATDGIKNVKIEEDTFNTPVHPNVKPAVVKIRPCAKEYNGKTFAGILIGDVAMSGQLYIKDDTIHYGIGHYNPLIYVPDLNKCIWGAESWWGRIKSLDDVKDISDSDIDNLWYVKMLKDMGSNV